MARRVFFSFHYERDVWRASQVRNSWVTKPDREAAGFWDAASWEEVKKKGEEAIKAWIREQLKGTSVTVVLIGTETSKRKYVQYEIEQSWEKGNGLIGVYIHNIKDKDKHTEPKGEDPFAAMGYKGIRTYDWVHDDGYKNLGDWVEAAYARAQSRNK
jgi:hypothetical protein